MKLIKILMLIIMAMALASCANTSSAEEQILPYEDSILDVEYSECEPEEDYIVEENYAVVLESGNQVNFGVQNHQTEQIDAPPPVKPTPTQEPTPPPAPIAGTVSISIQHGNRFILPLTQIPFEDGQTVFDVLRQTAADAGIIIDFRGRGSSVYVLGIGNLYEFDYGPQSGWVYTVNGEFVRVSSGVRTVAEGDVLRWIFTEEMGPLGN